MMPLGKFSIDRPNCRQVLDCASPSAFAARQSAAPARRRLALWVDVGGAKAVEGHRSPRRVRPNANFMRLLALALLLAAASSSLAQPTNQTDFTSFQIISQRNIFDPNRTARTRYSSTRSEIRAADSFSFVGMLSYAKGDFAFFDGPSPDYRKVLEPNSDTNSDIAIFKVIALTPKSVTLAAGTNVTVLPVGMEMCRDDNGHWAVATGSSPDFESGRRYSNRRRNFSYNASLDQAAADNSPANDTNSVAADEMAMGGTETNLPDAAPAPPGSGGNDPLAQLMQRRAQEEQQLGQGPGQ